ncbi:MAG: sulfurtransferase complex subunit TusD [Comamonadaceae bacterium]|nr:sulfurtransferase complex subunit TusD [Comamonadaceae bacterium]
MKFAIQINGAPYQCEGSDTGYQFIKAALRQGHEILRVFFYGEGIYNGLAYAMPPDDERQVVGRWSELAAQYGIDLVVCISAAQRRGLCEYGGGRANRQARSGSGRGLSHCRPRSLGRGLSGSRPIPGVRRLIHANAEEILFVLRHPPHGSMNAQESLDMILAAAAFDQSVSLLFLDDGVFQLEAGTVP